MNVIEYLKTCKIKKKKFATITVYDASFANIFFNQGIKIMLIGDSLGMTIQGHDSTIKVTIHDIIYHTKCVRRGAPSSFLISDLPFMSYSNIDKALYNAELVIRSGANMVKLEGGSWISETIKILTEKGIPVCAHIGLMPQSINIIGSYKVQGRTKSDSEKLFNDSLLLEKSGANLLVLECVPMKLAKSITDSLTIPVIGIGSGPYTDGQILVMQDILGITKNNIPSFSKNFFMGKSEIKDIINSYILEVENGIFPDIEHSFK